MHIHYFGEGAIVSNSYETQYLNSKEYIIFDIVARNYPKHSEMEIIERKILRDFEAKFSLSNTKKLIPTIRRFINFIDSDIPKTKYFYTGVKDKYYPVMLTLFLTNRCYHRCVHCFRSSSPSSNEMNIKDVNYILDEVRGKVPHIVLSGGEPLIHRNIEEISKKINGFLSTGIVTSLYDFKSDTVKKLDVFSDVQVSIYGWDEKSHDKFTNSKGSFEKVWMNIKQATSHGKDITITSMNNNSDKLEEIINLCISSGVKKLQFGEIVQLGRAESNTEQIYEFGINKKDICDLQDKYNDKIEILYDEGCFSDINLSYCGAGIYKLDIDEYGNIFPCLFGSKLSFGNIIRNKEVFDHKMNFNKNIVDNTNISCLPLKRMFEI